MKRINLVFEYDYDDAAILLVSDEIADNINAVVQEFFKWVGNPANNERFLVPYNGKMVLSVGTDAFLWWLNQYKKSEEGDAIVLQEHTTAVEGYPVADF